MSDSQIDGEDVQTRLAADAAARLERRRQFVAVANACRFCVDDIAASFNITAPHATRILKALREAGEFETVQDRLALARLDARQHRAERAALQPLSRPRTASATTAA